MTATVTPRQKDIFNFLLSYARERGYPPTIREIASHFNIISLNAVRVHLRALERKKLITLEKGRSRGIQLASPSLLESGLPGLPLMGKIAAGAPTLAEGHREDTIALNSLFRESSEPLYLLRVRGDSMAPEIQDGDLVIVKPQSSADTGDIVVALIEGEATVKTLLWKSGRPILHPLNPSYADLEPGENITINGKVMGIIRKY
jgi:repressor LexA